MREPKLFAHRINSQNGKYIVLVRGNFNNRKCWYYVLSDRLRMPVLLKKCQTQQQNLNIDDYGKVLKSGWGLEPPQYIQDKIEREGANFDNAEFAVPEYSEDQRFYVRSQDAEGRMFHVFIEVYGALTREFEIVVNYGSCDISAYGRIVEIGWGEPSAETMRKMQAIGFVLV